MFPCPLVAVELYRVVNRSDRVIFLLCIHLLEVYEVLRKECTYFGSIYIMVTVSKPMQIISWSSRVSSRKGHFHKLLLFNICESMSLFFALTIKWRRLLLISANVNIIAHSRIRWIYPYSMNGQQPFLTIHHVRFIIVHIALYLIIIMYNKRLPYNLCCCVSSWQVTK